MASSDLHSALQTLLPTLNSSFPPDLLSLSSSLLAQSRIRASKLKADEEIARPFACAEIACKRLKTKLRLPDTAGRSRPPCPPRVYGKLVTYFERVLPAKVPANMKRTALSLAANGDEDDGDEEFRTPSKKARTATSTPAKGVDAKLKTATKSNPTPRKKATFAGRLQDRNTTTKGKEEAPPHILPLIRRLCIAFSSTPAVPHVYTGFCVVLPLTDLDASDSRSTTALAIALFFMVLAKMQIEDSTLDSSTHLRRTDKAIEISGLGQTISSIDIDNWLTRISEDGWAMGREWWDNIPESVIPEGGVDDGERLESVPLDDNDVLDGDDEIVLSSKLVGRIGLLGKEEEEDEDGEAEDDDGIGILLPGLGTMMQEALDWGSEEKRREFGIWKKEIIERIRRIEKGGKGKGKQVAVH